MLKIIESYQFLLVLLMILQTADSVITYVFIKRYAGRERNPLVYRFMKRIGLVRSIIIGDSLACGFLLLLMASLEELKKFTYMVIPSDMEIFRWSVLILVLVILVKTAIAINGSYVLLWTRRRRIIQTTHWTNYKR